MKNKFYDDNSKGKAEQLIEKIQLYEQITGKPYTTIVTSGNNKAVFTYNGKLINLGNAIRHIRQFYAKEKCMAGWTKTDTDLVEKVYPGLLFAKKTYNYITPQRIIELVKLYEKVTGQSYNDINIDTKFTYNNEVINIGTIVISAKAHANGYVKYRNWTQQDIDLVNKEFPELLDKKSIASKIVKVVRKYEKITGKSYKEVLTSDNKEKSTFVDEDGNVINIGYIKSRARALVLGKKHVPQISSKEKNMLKKEFPEWFKTNELNGMSLADKFITKINWYEQDTGKSYDTITSKTKFVHDNQTINIGSSLQHIRRLIKLDAKHRTLTDDDINKIKKLYPNILVSYVPAYVSTADDLIQKIEWYEKDTGLNYTTIKTNTKFVHNGKQINIGYSLAKFKYSLSKKNYSELRNKDKKRIENFYPNIFVTYYEQIMKDKAENFINKIKLFEQTTGKSYKDITYSSKYIYDGKCIKIGLIVRDAKYGSLGKRHYPKWTKEYFDKVESIYPGLLQRYTRNN